MLPIYLPIAGLSIDAFLVIGVGLAVGVLSGLFGVGGGFLITPILLVLGIPIEVAIATGAAQTVATAASGSYSQWQAGNLDLKMGLLLLIGGVVGSLGGVQLVALLLRTGQIELVVSLCYVVLLGILGALMLIEGTRAIWKSRGGRVVASTRRRHSWVHNLPYKTRFTRSKLYMSMLPPLGLGVFVGLLGAVMGVGGGFVAVPFMVYALAMPTKVVIGTSLFQVFVTSAMATVMQAQQNYSVDVLLALLLIIGGVVGAQIGVRAGRGLKAEQLRALLGLLVLSVSVRIAIGLIVTPTELFVLDVPRGGR